MSRLILALCAAALIVSPTASPAGIASDFERPDAFRHAINAVIGDASYLHRFGTAPPPGADPDLRVRTHLEFVHALLSARDVTTLPAELRAARRVHLDRLREYIEAGVFPRNHLFEGENRPCFIDRDGRICAVGYLVEQSAGRDTAERINAAFQSEFLWRMSLPDLDRWIAQSGLTLLELSMIQPCYDPDFNLTVTRTGELTVTVRGNVIEYCCGMKYVAIDFGEAVWSSPDFNSYYIPVNITHTYSSEGAYAITAKAVAVDWCGNQVESMVWLVNLGASSMRLSAVEIPGGPPYRVYLTTTDYLHLDCMTSSLVQWNAYEPAQPTTWYLEGGVYRTPVHLYSGQGVKTVTATNSYQLHCATSQAGSVTVNVNGVAPTDVLTWGRVKAMYR